MYVYIDILLSLQNYFARTMILKTVDANFYLNAANFGKRRTEFCRRLVGKKQD